MRAESSELSRTVPSELCFHNFELISTYPHLSKETSVTRVTARINQQIVLIGNRFNKISAYPVLKIKTKSYEWNDEWLKRDLEKARELYSQNTSCDRKAGLTTPSWKGNWSPVKPVPWSSRHAKKRTFLPGARANASEPAFVTAPGAEAPMSASKLRNINPISFLSTEATTNIVPLPNCFRLSIRVVWPVFSSCSHGTLLRFCLLNICCYHQDLHPRLLQARAAGFDVHRRSPLTRRDTGNR